MELSVDQGLVRIVTSKHMTKLVSSKDANIEEKDANERREQQAHDQVRDQLGRVAGAGGGQGLYSPSSCRGWGNCSRKSVSS